MPFGDTSYDYKDRLPNNNMIVPTYRALHSFHLANSYMSDDFYTMMDDDEGDLGFSDRMDLAVGRIRLIPKRVLWQCKQVNRL